MVDGLPLKMRAPRKPRLFGGTTEGWYYVSPNAIEIYASRDKASTSVQLTRRQLEQALKIMDDFQERG